MRKGLPWVVAVGAIVLSGAGGAVAASQITGKQVKNSSLTGKDIKNKSLSSADFRGSVAGPQGPQGVPGPQGAPGPQGPAGPTGVSAITVVPGGMTVAGGEVDGGTILCPAGQRVISGGFFTDAAEGEVFLNVANEDRTGWIIAVDNLDSTEPAALEGEAYCAASGQAVAAGAQDRAAAAQAELDGYIARREAQRD